MGKSCLLTSLATISVTCFISCGENVEEERPPVEERVYCSGNADLPIDFEANPDLRIFCIRDQEDLDFFIEEYGHLGTYKKLLFDFYDGESLTDLRQIEIEHVYNLHIWDNNNLRSLEGLEGIEHVTNLEVYHNDKLTSLKGLENLKIVDYTIRITFNSSLKTIDLPALERMEEISDQSIRISDNKALEAVSGFNKLVYSDNIGIFENPVLERVEGFNALESTTDGLAISGNPRLQSIDGFENLQNIGSKCSMANNPMLPACFAEAFCERVRTEDTRDVFTFGNDESATCD